MWIVPVSASVQSQQEVFSSSAFYDQAYSRWPPSWMWPPHFLSVDFVKKWLCQSCRFLLGTLGCGSPTSLTILGKITPDLIHCTRTTVVNQVFKRNLVLKLPISLCGRLNGVTPITRQQTELFLWYLRYVLYAGRACLLSNLDTIRFMVWPAVLCEYRKLCITPSMMIVSSPNFCGGFY
jgi:hypothetical protein